MTTEPLVSLLRQLIAVIEQLDAEQYCAERARGISGSVGSQVRHCLDHVRAFVAGVQAGQVEYDARLRGTLVESRREAAVLEIQRLQRRLQDLESSSSNHPLILLNTLLPGGAVEILQSTVARELAFVVSHTIHHFAVIALLLRELGVGVPDRFGYAPSTPTPALNVRCA